MFLALPSFVQRRVLITCLGPMTMTQCEMREENHLSMLVAGTLFTETLGPA
jgi:hypothetical protein